VSYSREFVGRVAVKSGRLVIADPENIRTNARDLADKAPTAAARVDEGGEGDIHAGLGIAIPTPFRDGDYSVFVSKNDKNEVVSVEVSLEE
jgi:hypothetical protein